MINRIHTIHYFSLFVKSFGENSSLNLLNIDISCYERGNSPHEIGTGDDDCEDDNNTDEVIHEHAFFYSL